MKNKTVPAVALALLLIIAGAMLPHLWGKMQDSAVEGKVSFGTVSSIQLEFVQSSVSMTEILSIAARSTNSVEVPSDLAVRTPADIKRLASQSIEEYQEVGLIQHSVDSETQLQSIIPILRYDQTSSRKSNIFWQLAFAPADGSWLLELMIDDRTGRICSINYDYHVDPDYLDESYINTADPIYEDLEAALTQFSTVFLSQLGEEFSSLNTELIEQGTSISIDEGFASTSVSWADTIKGECHVVFYVMDTSFYTILY